MEGSESFENLGQNNVNVDGGTGAPPGTSGGARFTRPSNLEDLVFHTGSIVIDTELGVLTHSDGDVAYGAIEDKTHVGDDGVAWAYSSCRFSFTRIELGGGVIVTLNGRNALVLEATAGNVDIGANLQADGGDANEDRGGAGRLGGSDGDDAGTGAGRGPGAATQASAQGHGAAFGGHGSGDAKIYGDPPLNGLLGGSSGGASPQEGSGAGGGALCVVNNGRYLYFIIYYLHNLVLVKVSYPFFAGFIVA